MAAQEHQSFFQSRHPAMIRIWHWSFFLLMASTIIVVLFASQVFDTRGNAPMVMEEAMHRGVELSEKQARGIAHGFSEKLWVIHTYIGYGISFLLLSRMLIEVLVSKEARLINKIKKALAFSTTDPIQKSERKHFLGVKFSYIVFYLLVFTMVATGLGLAFEEIPFLDEIHRPLKKVHEFIQYGIYIFIGLHLFGVIRADLTKHKGIVSGMINGGE